MNNSNIKNKLTSIGYAGSRFDDTIDASGAGPVQYWEKYKKKGKWKQRLVTTNQGVTINAGDGDDKITGSNYNDTITGGGGSNTVFLNTDRTSLGDDTYYLSTGEVLNIRLKNDTTGTGNCDFKMVGKNLVITVYSDDEKSHKIGTLTVVRYGSDDYSAAGVFVYGVGGSDIPIPSFNQDAGNKTTLAGDNRYYEGSRYTSYVDASGVTQVMGARTYKNKKGKKVTVYDVQTGIGATVSTGKSNDTIIGSNYNDTITAGKGNNTIIFNENFGNDKIYLTDGENLTLDVSALNISLVNVKPTVSNGILSLNVANKGTITFANFNQVTPASIVLKFSNTESSNILTLPQWSTILGAQERSYSSFAHDMDINELVDARNVQELMGARKVKNKKGKKVTVWDVHTGYGTAINTGSGNDIIYSSKYNDTITAGDGNNTIYFDQPFGTDTVYLTNGEDLTLDITAFGYTEDDIINPDIFQYTISNGKMAVKVGDKGTIVFANLGETGINSGTCSLSLKFNNSDPVVDLFDLENSAASVGYSYNMGSQERNYTGTSLDESIDARNVQELMGARTYKNKKKKWVTVYDVHTGKGATIHGGDGNDYILGSAFSDNLYGDDGDDWILSQEGNDFIYGGSGDNTILIQNGDGIDRVYSGSGTDTLRFNNIFPDNRYKQLVLSTNGKDLIIQHTDNDKIIVDNYFAGNHSVSKIQFSSSAPYSLEEYINTYLSTRGDRLFFDDGTAVFKKLGADEKKPVLDNNTKYYIDASSVQLAGTGTAGDFVKVDLRNSTHDITYTGHDGNNNKTDDWVYTGSGNDTIYTNDGQNLVYAGTGENTINVNKGSGSRYTEIFTLGHDTVNIKDANTAGVYLYFDNETQDTVERAYDYYYEDTRDKILYKIGDDLRVNFTDDVYATVKDYYQMTNSQKLRVKVSGEDNAGDEGVATLTDLSGAYKLPVNVMWTSDSNTEKLSAIANTSINFWTNPDVARKDTEFVVDASSLQTNSNANATYNMHIQNGGVVTLYKGAYSVETSGTAKVQFDNATAGSRNKITNIHLNENSETKLMLSHSREWAIVTTDDANTAKIEIHSKEHAYDLKFYKVSSNGTQDVTGNVGQPCSVNDLIIHSDSGDYANFAGGAVILKDYFLANNGQGYNFGVKSNNMNYTIDDDGNPLWNIGDAYRLNVIPDEVDDDYTFIANSIFDEYCDGYQQQMANSVSYELKTNGKNIGWDTFIGTDYNEEYRFEFPEWGGMATINDADGIDFLKISYSNEDMKLFMDVDDTGSIGSLYFVENFDKMIEDNGDINDGIKIQNYGTTGRIETIRDASDYALSYDSLDDLAYEISGWLGKAGYEYSDTSEVFAGGNQDHINELMQIYENANAGSSTTGHNIDWVAP